ncbi:hypothetical protein [Cylindrospermum sp. FACHB-282]|uniref:hypothetical protein n=1 Tax=Cylindrospermum sp. FACHB-282 TaxID=2692794 RepID=UPI001685A892|nr:hypothetical protein [Cylindrospermum sp. FACHB-282]MBD2388863.1 hypothetical protein [Cylindrospermum sp. FACHB-282]
MSERETVETKSLNIKLINTLIQVIRSLSQEERQILEEKLFFDSSEPSNQELMKVAEIGGSFDFLHDEPDIYTLADVEPI